MKEDQATPEQRGAPLRALLGLLMLAAVVALPLLALRLFWTTLLGMPAGLAVGLAVALSGLAGFALRVGWTLWRLRGASATDRSAPVLGGALQLMIWQAQARRRPDTGAFWLERARACPFPDLAWDCLRRSAAAGHAEGHFELGLFLQEGHFGPARGEAARCFRAAAELGHAEAAFHYAEVLRWGLGPLREPREAMAWYRRSAEGGFAPAMDWLAQALERGDGVEADPAAAARWKARLEALPLRQGLRRASAPRPWRAAEAPGVEPGWKGEDLPPWERPLAETVARPWFSRLFVGAVWGTLLALLALLLGNLALAGMGLPGILGLVFGLPAPLAFLYWWRWSSRGQRWSRRGRRLEARAAAGDPVACHQLARHWELGDKEHPRDLVAARHWYQQAAQAGHGPSMLRLAELLRWRVAGPPDRAASLAWAARARELCVPGAEAWLRRLEEDERKGGTAEEGAGEGVREGAGEAALPGSRGGEGQGTQV